MVEISVVIPTYNRGYLIHETLDAILRQDDSAAEIIVVDDGSTDDTAAILSSYGDRVKTIRVNNAGDLVARNTGLRAAQSSLVAFCDSDDLWEPDFLSRMAAQWDSTPGLTAAYANFRTLDDRGLISSATKFDGAPAGYWDGLTHTASDAGVFTESRVAALIEFQPFFPSCMMVARDAFLEQGGWDESVSRTIGCDFATVLRVSNRPPIGAVIRPLVQIRKHSQNFSGNTEKMNLGDAEVLMRVLDTRPELNSLRQLFLDSAARRRRNALDSAFARRDFSAVRQINSMLPSDHRQLKQSLKVAIAMMPPPIGKVVARLLER